ncbi:MAG: peptide-methionine (R)-S-oxide reductase, partial [Gemmatimonadaceae bacterium]
MPNLTRREFALTATAVLASMCRPRSDEHVIEDIVIIEFSENGTRGGAVRVPKVVKSESEWRKQLSPLAYDVARRGRTERPFSGEYWDLHDKGLFRCICCETALFSSDAKFDSGTGWPSFWQPIAEENVHHGKPSSG